MKNKYQSLLVIVVGFLVFFFIFRRESYDWGFMAFKRIYFINAAVIIGVLSLVSDTFANLLLKGWEGIAHVLGYINTKIIMSAIFFLFLTPFALLKKIFSSKSDMHLKNDSPSVFVERNHEYKASDFDNIW
ncbi:MAG: SxtJ family membrane protein [Leadbetterella sp.]